MRKSFVLSFLFIFLCSLGVRAQKCLVMFGVNEEVTINTIKDPKFILMYKSRFSN